MTMHTNKKLQSLLELLPKGIVATSKWLAQLNISSGLVNQYKQSGWIKQFGHGAFSRSHDNIPWYGALHSLQFQLNLSIHLGGKSAIEYHGLSHYVSMGRPTVTLLKSPKTVLPKWFTDYQWPEILKITECGLFQNTYGIEIYQMDNIDLKISNRERAALELLYLTPRLYSFDEVPLIMESFASLREDVLVNLLNQCNSEKVKRLMLYFGEIYNFSWYRNLDLRKMTVGSSLLKIVPKNGKFIPQYNMFVPHEYRVESDTEIKF
ncbi:MAG: type IV toxin-antitoxin system AbiEi family antitoxin domain-containing protein [Alphaproteobacteria bacterium]|nr:type IV toxin-antitoxin system AbiEi family antitoxin domain-containing protein [Alphaproteobacteria bacterium]